jgi:hypothetical protein
MNPPPDRIDPPAAPPAPPAQYEFDEAQNKVIDDLASAMVWVGVPLFVLAVVYAIRSAVHFLRVGQNTAELIPAGMALLGAVFFALLAGWLRQGAAAFDRVTGTTGFDITHLMNGLRNLGKLFRLLALLVQIYLVLLAVLLVALLVGAFSARA